MKHTTTPYYEPKIFKTPAPKLEKKRFPWIHMFICFFAIGGYLALTIYNMVTQSEFISNGGLPGTLLLTKEIIVLCLLVFSGFLLVKKHRFFVWPFLSALVLSVIMALLFIVWSLPEDLMAQVEVPIPPAAHLERLGIATIIFLFLTPLLGAMADKLKLFNAHRELFNP